MFDNFIRLNPTSLYVENWGKNFLTHLNWKFSHIFKKNWFYWIMTEEHVSKLTIKLLQYFWNWVFPTNLNNLIPISLQPDGVTSGRIRGLVKGGVTIPIIDWIHWHRWHRVKRPRVKCHRVKRHVLNDKRSKRDKG